MCSYSINKYLGHLPWTLWYYLFLLNPQGMIVLRLIYPSPSFGLTRGDVFHPPLLPAGSTALTGDVARRSLPGGALPSVPSVRPPLPPPTPSNGSGKPPSSRLVIPALWHKDFPQLHPPLWDLSVPAHCSFYWQLRPPCSCITITQVQCVHGCAECRQEATGDGSPVTTIWPGEGAGLQRGWFLEWDLQTKSHLLLRNIEQFLSLFSLFFY